MNTRQLQRRRVGIWAGNAGLLAVYLWMLGKPAWVFVPIAALVPLGIWLILRNRQ